MSTLRPTKPAARRARDPLGKAALFSQSGAALGTGPIAPEPGSGVEPPPAATPHAPRRSRGPLRIECAKCGAVTRIGYSEFVAAQLPFSLWLPIPGRRHTNLARCPACEQRAWLSVGWLT